MAANIDSSLDIQLKWIAYIGTYTEKGDKVIDN